MIGDGLLLPVERQLGVNKDRITVDDDDDDDDLNEA